MKSELFNLPKYSRGLKNVCALCLIHSPSRNLAEEILRNWDEDMQKDVYRGNFYNGRK